LRVYSELQRQGARIAVVAVIDSNPEQAAPLVAAAAPGTPVFSSLEEYFASARQALHAASVCVPTSAHAVVASTLLKAGVDALVEKPITTTLSEADTLISLAHQHGRILQVGHLERFNPAVVAMQERVRSPMFFEAHRLSLFAPRSLDVDVVLDLMIHDLDIVLSVVNSPVRELHAVGLPIVSATADIASVRVEFESGCVANFTASRVSTERVRKLRLFQPHQYISVDYARQDLLVIAVDRTDPTAPTAPAYPANAQARAALQAHSPLPLGLTLSKPAVTPGEPLRREIESFLQSVRHRTPPAVTGKQARDALALALDIYDAMAAHRERAGLNQHQPSSLSRSTNC
jgi:predicted dehydrogenase